MSEENWRLSSFGEDIWEQLLICLSPVCLSPASHAVAVPPVSGCFLSANHRQSASVFHCCGQSPAPASARPETLLRLRRFNHICVVLIVLMGINQCLTDFITVYLRLNQWFLLCVVRRALCNLRSSVNSTKSSCRIFVTQIISSALLTSTRPSAALWVVVLCSTTALNPVVPEASGFVSETVH